MLGCRRRLVKRIYIPMPDAEGRRSLLKHTLEDQPMKLSATDLERLVQVTEGYSGSDLAALCREAAMQPIRCATHSFLEPRPENLLQSSESSGVCCVRGEFPGQGKPECLEAGCSLLRRHGMKSADRFGLSIIW
jgi:SpoVK/Ycf46/Vps4 family AAA+-type ATPase